MLPRICFGLTLLIALSSLWSSAYSKTSAMNLNEQNQTRNSSYIPRHRTYVSGYYVRGVWVYYPGRSSYSTYRPGRSSYGGFRGGGPGTGK